MASPQVQGEKTTWAKNQVTNTLCTPPAPCLIPPLTSPSLILVMFCTPPPHVSSGHLVASFDAVFSVPRAVATTWWAFNKSHMGEGMSESEHLSPPESPSSLNSSSRNKPGPTVVEAECPSG